MINDTFFSHNRVELLKATKANVIILAAYNATQRRSDMSAAFEQEANFWYLSGIEAPAWKLVITKTKSYLIAPDVDTVHQVFDGSLSFNEAKKRSGVDEVVSTVDGKKLIDELAKKHATVHTIGKDPRASHYDFELNNGPVTLLRNLKKSFKEVKDCRRELSQLRAIKQPEEIVAMKKAIALTVKAFKDVQSRLDEFTHEYEVEAAFSHYFRSRGAKGHAYEPIVAAGKNACTLHYIDNNDALNKNELLLIDIGAQVDGYAADITRTYAIGTPTKRQVEVHKAVEAAHHAIIALLKPGLSIVEYSDKVDEIMKNALKSLDLLKKDSDYRKYFPHAVSHGLGVDVHDSLGGPEVFKTGMVLTVEPGIYIPEEGIGIRIEDDILITDDGYENLSADLPTSVVY